MYTVKLITPEKILFSAEAEMVTIPGTEGEFGVLEGHAPFVSTLRPGIITIESKNGEKRKIAVTSGIAEVTPEHCNILAEQAADCQGLTEADLQARLQQAKEAVEMAVTEEAAREAAKKLTLAEAMTLAA